MSCWCDEVYNYKCTDCEAKELYRNLSPMDRDLIKYFEKNMDNLAIRTIVDKFEDRHKKDWTDFIWSKNE
jgi:hypothetical protein